MKIKTSLSYRNKSERKLPEKVRESKRKNGIKAIFLQKFAIDWLREGPCKFEDEKGREVSYREVLGDPKIRGGLWILFFACLKFCFVLFCGGVLDS